MVDKNPNTSNPKVGATVIIPAWNEEKYISKCLDSLSGQKTDFKYEVIVVNNNSNDGTKDVAESMGFRVIDEPNQGVSLARNKGAEEAKGEILIFIDADCVLPADFVNKVIIFFENNADVSVLAGPYIYTDGGPIVRFVTEKLNYYYLYFRVVKFLNGFQGLSGGNMAVRKDVFEKMGGFSKQITNIIEPEDLEFAARLSENNIKIRYDKSLTVYSSFRRTKRSPFRDAYRRYLLARKILRKYRVSTKF